MIEFFQIILSFPTIVFTILLGLVLIFGFFTMIGAIGFEILDGFFGVEEVGEIPDSDGLTGATGVSGVLRATGLAGIPLSLVAMFIIIWSWIFSFLLMYAVRRAADPVEFGARLGVGVGALILGGVFAGISLRPFRRVFQTVSGQTRHSLVGRYCTIRSTHVDAYHGRAEIDDGGSGVIAEVRSTDPNTFTVGSKARVAAYDPRLETFTIVPIEP